MNQFEIEKILNTSLAKAEADLEIVFAKRLKTILYRISEMYRKYESNGKLSFTDLNRYNRYEREMKLIAKLLTEDYKEVVKMIQEQTEYQYVTKYLLTAYLIEQSITPAPKLGFSIPSVETIKRVLLNPIAELTLPKIMEGHRDEIVRKIRIEIAQGLIAGEGYATIAKRIEKAVGFSSTKARLVARTEGGRSRSIAGEKVFEQASENADLKKVWVSSLDMRVRQAHRELDSKEADKDGYFRYKGNKTKAPRLWVGPDSASLTIQCRCVLIVKVNGILPEVRRGRNYNDEKYQRKLSDRIDELMADEDLTFLQAFNKANKEIQPPSTVIPFVTYQEWYDSMLAD